MMANRSDRNWLIPLALSGSKAAKIIGRQSACLIKVGNEEAPKTE
jgi:hypothetical protein